MENNHDIDKKFSEASQAIEEPATFPGFDKVWAKVEEKLDQKEEKKRILPVWLPYGIAASLIIGLGAFYFINKNSDEKLVPSIVQKATPQETPPHQDITQIDSTIQSNIKKEVGLNKEQIQNVEKIATKNGGSILIKQDINNLEIINTNKLQGDTLRTDDIREVLIAGALGVKKRVDAVVGSNQIIATNSLSQNSNYGFYNNSNAVNSSPQIAASNYQNNAPNSNLKNEFSSNNNATFALQGKLSGVNITNSNNNITGSPKIQIRGMRSVSGNNNALIVIDNVISSADALSQIPPNKIKSQQILKGAQATALYGNDAGNGVVLIYTNRSRKEKREFRKKLLEFKKAQDSIKKAKQLEKMNSEEYDAFVENPFELTKNQAVSTFSIDVDNAAYSNVRRMINNGEYVDKNAVRIEEMINYFKYPYPQPKNDQPFSINSEYSDSPWNSKHKLLKIGLQGKNIPMEKLPTSNLVFLIDVSGSMEAQNKLPLLKSSFKVLLEQLRPQDKVGIVVYAGNAGMVLPMTSAKEKSKIIDALYKLQAGGSTAGGAGIELAYKMAQENFVKGGNNRVIIATDGDFNVGTSSTGDLQTLIEEKRKSGVFLTCLGFGMGNFKDNRMETLADKGNGNYAYIDNMQEANKFLGKEFSGTLYAIAKDVKIQIEFNPQFVKSYRLIGYENRKLKNEDFNNDAIDAGELGSGHTVTALYEIIPADVKSEFLPNETELKYSNSTSNSNFGDELATVKFRYKKQDGDKSTEMVQVVKNTDVSLNSASEDFKFASSVAWFGLVLRNSKLITDKDLKNVEKLAKKGKSNDSEGYKAEFVRLVEAYQTIIKGE